jgi:group I intron endonuclease
MAYIYKIVNDINDKIYIGKTNFSIGKRFQEHCRDKDKRRNEQRPLYFAMNKYGVEHFHIELVEETNSPEEREVYWINYYNSYHNGYNATLGGDGKTLINYQAVLDLFDNTNLTQQEIAEKCNCSKDSIKNIVSIYRENVNWNRRYILSHSSEDRHLLNEGLSVKCIETQQIFPSCMQAGKWLQDIGAIKSSNYGKNRIAAVVQGKIKQNKVGGYSWEKV